MIRAKQHKNLAENPDNGTLQSEMPTEKLEKGSFFPFIHFIIHSKFTL